MRYAIKAPPTGALLYSRNGDFEQLGDFCDGQQIIIKNRLFDALGSRIQGGSAERSRLRHLFICARRPAQLFFSCVSSVLMRSCSSSRVRFRSLSLSRENSPTSRSSVLISFLTP